MLKIWQKLIPFSFNSLTAYILVSTIILFFFSSLRHILFNSHAFDLGIFDNGIYLISQGKEPYVSFRNLHILGDHSAWILYFIALFYLIYPTIYWLFVIQAFTLSVAILPIYHLSKLYNLSNYQAKTVCLIYLLYPLIFNVNLFDFHPEVIAIPLFFTAILTAKLNKFNWFIICIVLILGCKAVLALNIIALGIWLILGQKRKKLGIFAIIMGLAWFIIATQLIIPHFSGEEVAAVNRYAFLGDSVTEIGLNLILKPNLILSHLFTLANLEYLLLLFVPFVPVLAWQKFSYLIPALPTLLLNLITDYQPQKDLVHQYSLPIIPFLILVVIASLASKKTWFKQNFKIKIWSLIAFLALAKYVYFFPNALYFNKIDTWRASREAINLIKSDAAVLTAPQYAPHLTHRPVIKLAINNIDYSNIGQFEYILVNLKYPSGYSSTEAIQKLIDEAKKLQQFQLIYENNDIFLFENKKKKYL